MSDELWQSNHVQFARLLAEIRALDIPWSMMEELATSMDLTPDQIWEILERAEKEFQQIKAELPNVNTYRCRPFLEEAQENDRGTIYAILHSHEHGVSVYLAHTGEMARKYIENLVKYYRKDVETFHIPDNISDKDAAEDWFALTGGQENLEVVCCGFVEESPEEWHE